ncbi:MAG: DUF1697 domain-containing protein [Bacteroidota bacterium]
MPVFLSILRGINVSGQKKISMSDLKILYEELKFKNVTTYIQSGNVVFEHNSEKKLQEQIEKKISEKYNFEVPVVLRTVDEMQQLINKSPFLKEKNIDLEKLHVTYLAELPDAAHVKKIEEYNFEPDRFTISGKEVYIYCPNGYGRSKLTNNFFENKLKVTATTRNWKTSNELLKIMQSYK